MGFGFAGAGAGAANALEDILKDQMVRAQLAQREREQAEQMALQKQQLASADVDRVEGRRLQGQQIELGERNRRDKNNQQGLEVMQADKTQMDQDAIMAGLNPKLRTIAGLRKVGVSGIQPEDLDTPEERAARDQTAITKAGKIAEAQAAGAAKYRDPSDKEPLVAIMGPDNLPVLVKRSAAEGKRPASTREQGRPVMVSSAKDLADIDEAMKLTNQLHFDPKDTGIMPAIGGALPDAVTNLTGFGMEAKKRQGVINLVKQIIGKGLEGGVLRKEDESKYEKILPTLSDPPEVVTAKIANLTSTMSNKRSTLLDSLTDAGFDTSRFTNRGEPKPANVNDDAAKRAADLISKYGKKP